MPLDFLTHDIVGERLPQTLDLLLLLHNIAAGGKERARGDGSMYFKVGAASRGRPAFQRKDQPCADAAVLKMSIGKFNFFEPFPRSHNW